MSAQEVWFSIATRNPDECWPWVGLLNKGGYGHLGKMYLGQRYTLAHRLVWVLTNGPITDGLFVCHSCDDRYPAGDISYRSCCNPSHLFLGTNADNSADCKRKGRHAHGDRHGSRTHPECLPRGDESGPRKHRDRMVRGDAHWTRSRPEQIQRGARHHAAKLDDARASIIRARVSAGEMQKTVALEFGVSTATVSLIIKGKRWVKPELIEAEASL